MVYLTLCSLPAASDVVLSGPMRPVHSVTSSVLSMPASSGRAAAHTKVTGRVTGLFLLPELGSVSVSDLAALASSIVDVGGVGGVGGGGKAFI